MRIPVNQPAPDFGYWLDVVVNGREPTRAATMEYLMDEEIRREIGVRLLDQQWVPFTRENREKYLRNFIDFWWRLGYDYVRYEEGCGFSGKHKVSNDAAGPLSRGQRGWIDEGVGVITSWSEFEDYPWPDPDKHDFINYEFIAANLPDGMGFIVSHGAGVFENAVEWLLGFEGVFTMICEEPELAEAVFDRVGGTILRFYERLLEIPGITAAFQGDDMGFGSGTFLPPDALKKCVLKWHKKFAQLAHSKGMPYFLHSCGNIMAIMDDLIDDVKIDGRHSTEDVILPVPEFKKRVYPRIAALGGVDINRLAQGREADVRAYVRGILASCMPGGKYAIGSGNSIANYIPVANYLAMLDEAHAWRA